MRGEPEPARVRTPRSEEEDMLGMEGMETEGMEGMSDSATVAREWRQGRSAVSPVFGLGVERVENKRRAGSLVGRFEPVSEVKIARRLTYDDSTPPPSIPRPPRSPMRPHPHSQSPRPRSPGAQSPLPPSSKHSAARPSGPKPPGPKSPQTSKSPQKLKKSTRKGTRESMRRVGG